MPGPLTVPSPGPALLTVSVAAVALKLAPTVQFAVIGPVV